MIITIAHIKGGTGKTTTAFQVALQRKISHPERKVWLIDADEQHSALDTVSVRSSQGLIPSQPCGAYATKDAFIGQLNAQVALWDDIIIDVGGRDTDALRLAIYSANKLIVPVLPRAYDVWALSRLETVVNYARELGSNVESFAFINRFDKTAETKQSIEFLKENETFKLMNSKLTDRMAYAKAGGSGKAVSEMRPIDKTAVKEIAELTQEIFGD